VTQTAAAAAWRDVITFRRLPPGSPEHTCTCPRRHRTPEAAYACGARSLRTTWAWTARGVPVGSSSAFSSLALTIRQER